MNKYKYFRGSFRQARVEQDASGNKSIIISPLFKGKDVDFANSENLKVLAYNARKQANGLYDLVMEKYKGSSPAYIPNFEMLVALANLSSEFYIKCIIYFYELNGGKQFKGFHNLKDYYLQLPDEIKSALKRIDDDFDGQLETIANYFNEFRYSFEFNHISTTAFPFTFAEKLHEICNSIEIKRPPEFVCSDDRVLFKQGEDTVWDSSKPSKPQK